MLNKEEEQVKKDEPIKPKSNSKPRILILKSEPRYSINETMQGVVPFKELKTSNPR